MAGHQVGFLSILSWVCYRYISIRVFILFILSEKGVIFALLKMIYDRLYCF